MIAKGVRFNAEKKRGLIYSFMNNLMCIISWIVGKYMSSSIWEFKMRCPHCSNIIIVETDPENCDYKYKEGAKRIVNLIEWF